MTASAPPESRYYRPEIDLSDLERFTRLDPPPDGPFYPPPPHQLTGVQLLAGQVDPRSDASGQKQDYALYIVSLLLSGTSAEEASAAGNAELLAFLRDIETATDEELKSTPEFASARRVREAADAARAVLEWAKADFEGDEDAEEARGRSDALEDEECVGDHEEDGVTRDPLEGTEVEQPDTEGAADTEEDGVLYMEYEECVRHVRRLEAAARRADAAASARRKAIRSDLLNAKRNELAVRRDTLRDMSRLVVLTLGMQVLALDAFTKGLK